LLPQSIPISTLFPYTPLCRSSLISRSRCRMQNSRERSSEIDRYVDRYVYSDLACVSGMATRSSSVDLDVACRTLERRELMRSRIDRKSTRLNSSHVKISYAVF